MSFLPTPKKNSWITTGKVASLGHPVRHSCTQYRMNYFWSNFIFDTVSFVLFAAFGNRENLLFHFDSSVQTGAHLKPVRDGLSFDNFQIRHGRNPLGGWLYGSADRIVYICSASVKIFI